MSRSNTNINSAPAPAPVPVSVPSPAGKQFKLIVKHGSGSIDVIFHSLENIYLETPDSCNRIKIYPFEPTFSDPKPKEKSLLAPVELKCEQLTETEMPDFWDRIKHQTEPTLSAPKPKVELFRESVELKCRGLIERLNAFGVDTKYMFPKGFDLTLDQCESLNSLFENNTEAVDLGVDGNFLVLCFNLCCACPRVKFDTLKFILSIGFCHDLIKTVILTGRQHLVDYMFDKMSFDSQYMTRQYDQDDVIFKEEIKRLLRTSFRITDSSFIVKAIDLCIHRHRFDIITDIIFEDKNINKSISNSSLEKAICSAFKESVDCGLTVIKRALERRIAGIDKRREVVALSEFINEGFYNFINELLLDPNSNRIGDLSFLEIVCLCGETELRDYFKADGSFTHDDLLKCIKISIENKNKAIFEILLCSKLVDLKFMSSIMLDVGGYKDLAIIVCNRIKSLCLA